MKHPKVTVKIQIDAGYGQDIVEAEISEQVVGVDGENLGAGDVPALRAALVDVVQRTQGRCGDQLEWYADVAAQREREGKVAA